MRQVPPGLKAHLDGQVTTLCFCWRLTRTDGRVFGFTDHDAAIRFENTVFEAATGMAASEAETELGLAAGAQEIEGALSAAAIEEGDIAAGRFDGARVETFLVNWAAPDDRLLLDAATLGEVKRAGLGFAAELRGLAARLDRVRGRIYRRRCDASFGDGRCKVNAAATAFVRAGTVAAVDSGGALRLQFAGALDPALFAPGRIRWTGGAAAGLVSDLDTLVADGASARATVIGAPPPGIAAGDALELLAGCDKSFATCRGRFNNAANFRGFPHLPGNDAGLAVAKKDGRHDGAPLVP